MALRIRCPLQAPPATEVLKASTGLVVRPGPRAQPRRSDLHLGIASCIRQTCYNSSAQLYIFQISPPSLAYLLVLTLIMHKATYCISHHTPDTWWVASKPLPFVWGPKKTSHLIQSCFWLGLDLTSWGSSVCNRLHTFGAWAGTCMSVVQRSMPLQLRNWEIGESGLALFLTPSLPMFYEALS